MRRQRHKGEPDVDPRKPNSLFPLGIVVMLVAVVLAAPALANGNVWGNLFGSILEQAAVQNAEKSWAAVDQPVQECLIHRYNLVPAQLAQHGITAEDSRLAAYMQSCREIVAQTELQEKQQQRAAAARQAVEAVSAKLARQEQRTREAAAKVEAKTRHEALVAKYGATQAAAIEAHKVVVGMSKDAVIAAIGQPRGKEVIPPNDELWTYGALRVSISGGKVTYVGQ